MVEEAQELYNKIGNPNIVIKITMCAEGLKATKRLKEKILSKEFSYTANKLLEINFQNSRCVYDTNKNLYVAKKKSTGKVDMVVSLINAMYLVEQDYFINVSDFTVQLF